MEQEATDQEKFVEEALMHGLGVVRTEDAIKLVDKQGKAVHTIATEETDPDWASLRKELGSLFSNADANTASRANPVLSDLIIYTDGGSRGNPGPSASGFVIMDQQEQIIEEGGEYIGITTNNQAEYRAVLLALETAVKYQPEQIEFRIDSLLVVNQMNGVYKIKNRDLWPIHSAIKSLCEQLEGEVRFVHVRREFNTLADQKVNEILDAQK